MLLDIMSNNTESLTVNGRLWEIQRFLREHHLDILAVQETHLTAEDVSVFERIFPDTKILANNGNRAERGVAIFYSSNAQMDKVNLEDFFTLVSDLTIIETGRLIIANIRKEDFNFTLVNAYALNNMRDRRIFSTPWKTS